MKTAGNQPNLANIADRALELVEHRFVLFRLRPSAANRLGALQDLRAVAMREVDQFGMSEADEFKKKAAALLVCGIDDGIGALSDADPNVRARLELSAKKKLESALHSVEFIRNKNRA